MFVDRVLYGGPGRAAAGARGARRRDRARCAGVRASIVRVIPLRLVALGGLLLSIGGLVAMSSWTPESEPRDRSRSRWRVRLWLRADRDAALDRRRRGGRPSCVRHGVGDRHRRADARDGGRAGDPDRLWLDHHRPAVRRGLRHIRRLSPVHPGSAPRPAAARSTGRRRARGLGVARGGVDHGRALPRRGRGDRRGHPAGPGPRRPAREPDAYAGSRDGRDRRDRGDRRKDPTPNGLEAPEPGLAL